MRVNYKWLSDYVDLTDVPPQTLADGLTMVGLEVEELIDRYAYLATVLVARVDRVDFLPNSDHLKKVEIQAGDTRATVVCGAPNVAEGQLTAWARPGTVLPDGREIQRAEIKGVFSDGMLCSEVELALGLDAGGIMVLPGHHRPGEGLRNALNLKDWILEVGITPNRPDCLSVLGLAREAAGVFKRNPRPPKNDLLESGPPIESLTSVTIMAPEHCPRFTARMINGLTVGPSPFWMVDRLAAAGVRSINNIVDITNFVMLEMGQPLHSFDLERLEEQRIVVRTAHEGERFTTLDGNERILGPAMLMICDGQKPVGLAGVMGGLNSEIADSTTNVLLESAYFNPVSIRRTSKTLGLSTEASYRFERGIDPNLCLHASYRATALMAQLGGGTVARGIIDANPVVARRVSIAFSPSRCNAYLGTDFPPEEVLGNLAGIGLVARKEAVEWRIEVPTFRVDLTREVDLFEEVARTAGFHRVPATLPPARTAAEPMSPSRQARAQAREILEGLGATEVINYSFIAEDFTERLQLPEKDRRRRTVRILNPLSEDQTLMRTTLVPGLLDVLRRNQSFGVSPVAVYEIGQTFFDRPDQDLPEERLAIAGLLAGRHEPAWYRRVEAIDFYDLKGIVEDLLTGLSLPAAMYDREDLPAYYDPTAAARIRVDGRVLGWLGRVTPAVAKAFGLRGALGEIGGEAYVFELDLPTILECCSGTPQYVAPPRFPYVERDLALVLDRSIDAAAIPVFIQSLGESTLEEIFLFDAYEGRQIAAGRKSLAFRFRYRAAERTLTDDEVNAVHQRITDRVLTQFQATMRG